MCLQDQSSGNLQHVDLHSLMGALASSHTCWPSARLLLLLVITPLLEIVLGGFCALAVADTSASRTVQDMNPTFLRSSALNLPRHLLPDASPPRMWAKQDQDRPQAQDEFLLKSLLTGIPAPFSNSRPGNGGEDAHDLQTILAADKFRLRGCRPFAPDKISKALNQAESLADGSQTGHGIRTNAPRTQNSEHPSYASQVHRRRLLQADISPPGMWPDSDDDESEMLWRRRRLLHLA